MKLISNALEELAGLLGAVDVTFHSQHSKAKVSIGVTATSKQAPLLMHMEYKVTLLDHDYVIAPQHKLISFIIGDMGVREKDFSGDVVTYSGPMYLCTVSFEVQKILTPVLITKCRI